MRRAKVASCASFGESSENGTFWHDQKKTGVPLTPGTPLQLEPTCGLEPQTPSLPWMDHFLRGASTVSIRVYAIRPDILPLNDPFHSKISVTSSFQGAPVIVKVCASSSPPGAGRGGYRVLACRTASRASRSFSLSRFWYALFLSFAPHRSWTVQLLRVYPLPFTSHLWQTLHRLASSAPLARRRKTVQM